MIVCRECGKTWPSTPKRTRRHIDLVGETKASLESKIVEAEHRPLVTYSDGAEAAWAAKVEGDYWPEPPRQRRLPMMVGAVAALFFLAAFFGAREAAVRALPDLAGLYAAIGLPVHLEGIAIEDVAADRAPGGAGDRILVRGIIRNVSGRELRIPQLAASLHDSAWVPALSDSFDPPAERLSAGESAPFLLTFEQAPPLATNVAVRLRRPGEPRPPGQARAPSAVQ